MIKIVSFPYDKDTGVQWAIDAIEEHSMCRVTGYSITGGWCSLRVEELWDDIKNHPVSPRLAYHWSKGLFVRPRKNHKKWRRF